ncbi:MAG: ribosome biogenesis factor YjgA [Mariprofundaceae bacterium]|nr:ribosome biogenesis factor YjgA [Mariprofundaceae bacterium]
MAIKNTEARSNGFARKSGPDMYEVDKPDEEESHRPNKSRLKREADALFELGKRLAELEMSTLQSLELPNELLTAIKDARKIHAHAALKRQFKLVGKLLRSIDTTALQELIEKRELQHQKGVSEFHHIEKWRDRLINEGSAAVSDFLSRYPDVDRQRLNQLVRGAAKELQLGNPPRSARLLFKFLRDSIG